MGIKFELRVVRSLFMDSNIFDPPPTTFLTETEMISILKMCKIRNKSLYEKIKNDVWNKLDNRFVDEV
jgi:hypothetical protein